MTAQLRNNPMKVALASMVGTAIEFFDYYIYAAAAVLVFNTQFFHSDDPLSNDLLSLSTLALAFFARPIGSALFGHFGDKIGRKKTLVASLLLMGGSTVLIGLLPSYSQIGIWAPILLCICRVGQGIGLGGEWGGAALVATENAPEGKRAWYGTFPQLGAPIGLFVANGTFFLVSYFWGQEALVEWAWRIPFISSVLLVFVGLYVRLTLHESHVFIEAEQKGKKLNAPVSVVFTKHLKPMVIGTFIMVATYSLFYIMTAFAQAYSRTAPNLSEAGHPLGLGIPANTFTGLLLISAIVFGIFISISGIYADKIGRRKWLIWVTIAIGVLGLSMPLFLQNGTPTSVFAFLIIGMAIMGMTFGPMAALLPELFPTEVRYSGASLAYNLASIIGATVAAMISLKINALFGVMGVGIYLAINALMTLLALFASKETKNIDLTQI
ncbi:MFS transporter [Rodentibacter caecimuris]|uniref:MFS transporter n=1 Tax=Rodentibacter caecimuris TaxID=1796644 RepID=UPI001094A087|nr:MULTISPECIES: MFS transporter [Pasteurellaceae]MCQ9124453.1 MHS family MFS transporter [Rodentibacter heylii]MCR1837575.1 MHS family MFS transporter [Pasteurella caecimuris]MCU0107100.1 MHS family MFS transporter [Pasteurella caecimuris]MCX2960714.1 MHS family MFS transporter [Rodentibacter heylii]QIA77841.1 MHS family MFS transporter [Rodentibacter heylii]